MARPKKQTPPSGTKDRRTEILVVGIILVVSAMLVLANLGNIYLWQDEAQTACISKTVLAHGIPLGYDGKNHFSQEFGREYGKDYVWRWHTWLPFYVLAGFFAAFGTSNFACRLPFALAGIGTVILTYFYARSLWHTRRAAVLAAILLLLSVPFLLLARQCRYYSMTALFSVAGLYAYSEMLKGRRYAPAAFVISACLLFHTFYVYVPALLGAAIIHSAIFRRDRLKLVLAASIIAGAINLPWMIWLSRVYGTAHAEAAIPNRNASLALMFVRKIGRHIFTPALLILPILSVTHEWIRRRERPRPNPDIAQSLALLLLFAMLVLIALVLTAPNSFFRYLAPLVPVLIMIEALILDRAMRIHPAVGLVVLALMASHARIPDYLYEITHDYNGPVEATVKLLRSQAHPGDIVTTTHEDLPLKWYTGLRVIGVATGEDLSQASRADWIVFRGHIPEGDWKPSQTIINAVGTVTGRKYVLDCADLEFENREAPDKHFFRTVKSDGGVIVLQRIKG